MAPKIRQRKKNFNQPKSSDNDNEDTQVSEGEDGDGEPFPSRHQQIIQPLTGNSTMRTTCQQLGDSAKWLEGPDNLKFLNPIQIYKLERDKILPNPKNSEDLVFYSLLYCVISSG